jgi:ABC-type transporter Mla subunit MlaD
MEEEMDEKRQISINRIFFIIIIIAFVVFTIMAGYYFRQYHKLRELVNGADGTNLYQRLLEQESTIITLSENLSNAKLYIATSIEYSEQLSERNRRAIAIVNRSDERLNDFENAVDESTDIIEKLTNRQSRINELITGIRADNRQLTATLIPSP